MIPVANWRAGVYIGGTAASNLVPQIGEWALTVKRQLQVYFTVQNSANPYVIARGPLSASFSLKYTAPYDESALAALLYLGYQWIHIVLDNGLSGTSHIRLTIDGNTGQATKSKPGSSSVLIDFDNTFDMVANSTNVGGSGGLSPIIISLLNAVATY